MKKKLLLVPLLVFSILCTSCDFVPINKLRMNRIMKIYDEAGYEQVEIDEIVDGFEDYSSNYRVDKDLEDGVYAVADTSREIKRAFDGYGGLNLVASLFEYDKDMQQVCWFTRLEESYNSSTVLTGISIRYDSTREGEEYLDEAYDNLQDFDIEDIGPYYTDFEYDRDKDGLVECLTIRFSAEIEPYGEYEYYIGLYIQGRYAFILFGMDYGSTKCKRDIEDICDAIGVVSPTDL